MKLFVGRMCIVLVLCIVLAVPVSAVSEDNQRASLYFAAYSVYIYKTGDTTFKASYEVIGKNTMQEIGAKSLLIQESDDGVTWTTIRTYTSEFYPQMICENTGYHSWWFGGGAVEGKCYRLKVVLYAKNSNGSAERTVYSDPVWF